MFMYLVFGAGIVSADLYKCFVFSPGLHVITCAAMHRQASNFGGQPCTVSVGFPSSQINATGCPCREKKCISVGV